MAKRTREEIRKNMQAIRSQNTKIEVMVAKALWQKGYRYRKNNKKVYGKPDFTFRKIKLAIFCDSIFWHGKDWALLNKRIKTNREFWVKKIERNIARDKKVNQELKKQGWVVLRFWENDIEKDIQAVVSAIEVAIIFLRHCEKELKGRREEYRAMRKKLQTGNYPRYTSDEELVQSMPHLFE
jgi:DNA mismatch endonuclease Vsr